MPGVVSDHGAPKRMRSKGRFSISMRGMPKFVSLDESISLKAKRVALTRASLIIEDESVRVHVIIPKRLLRRGADVAHRAAAPGARPARVPSKRET